MSHICVVLWLLFYNYGWLYCLEIRYDISNDIPNFIDIFFIQLKNCFGKTLTCRQSKNFMTYRYIYKYVFLFWPWKQYSSFQKHTVVMNLLVGFITLFPSKARLVLVTQIPEWKCQLELLVWKTKNLRNSLIRRGFSWSLQE